MAINYTPPQTAPSTAGTGRTLPGAAPVSPRRPVAASGYGGANPRRGPIRRPLPGRPNPISAPPGSATPTPDPRVPADVGRPSPGMPGPVRPTPDPGRVRPVTPGVPDYRAMPMPFPTGLDPKRSPYPGDQQPGGPGYDGPRPNDTRTTSELMDAYRRLQQVKQMQAAGGMQAAPSTGYQAGPTAQPEPMPVPRSAPDFMRERPISVDMRGFDQNYLEMMGIK